MVEDPRGQEIILPIVLMGSTHRTEFVPRRVGVHHINVFQNKHHIAGSPFQLDVESLGNFSELCK